MTLPIKTIYNDPHSAQEGGSLIKREDNVYIVTHSHKKFNENIQKLSLEQLSILYQDHMGCRDGLLACAHGNGNDNLIARYAAGKDTALLEIFKMKIKMLMQKEESRHLSNIEPPSRKKSEILLNSEELTRIKPH